MGLRLEFMLALGLGPVLSVPAGLCAATLKLSLFRLITPG